MISCWKMLTFSLQVQLCLFSTSYALPKSDSTVQKECQDFRTMPWSYNSFTEMKGLEGKQNCITNVVWTTATNNQSGSTSYYLKQRSFFVGTAHNSIKKPINSEGFPLYVKHINKTKERWSKLVWIDFLSCFEIYWWKAFPQTKGALH